MASNNNTHGATPGPQNTANMTGGIGLGDHGHPQQGQHHDSHGPAGVPIMHVDELLSAEFPLNMSNGAHSAGTMNSGATHANIMDGLDDLFGDDFTTPSTTAASTATTGAAHSNVGIPQVHLPQQSQPQHNTVSHSQILPPNIHFPSTSGPAHSPQPRVLQQHPHPQTPGAVAMDSPSAIPAPMTPGHHTPGARISPQTPQPAPTAHISHAPQIATPGMHAMQHNRPQAIASPALPQQYQQQVALQQHQAALQQQQQQAALQQQHLQQAHQHAHLSQQSLQPAVAPRPVFPSPQHHQAAVNQAAALLPRPVQPNIVQMPPTVSTAGVPNGHTPIPTVATPILATPTATPTPTPAPAAPVVLAGSPLAHILGTTSPETGQQLRNLFTLLQTNVVTPNEFLARAEQLLEPAQFKILDVIRRRHVPQPQQSMPQSLPTSAASTPAANSPITTANPSAASSPMHQPTTAGIVRPAGAQHISTPAVPTLGQPTTPQPTPVAPAAMAPQSAPVRKRNIDTTSVSTPPNESKTKRPKMEQQQIVPGAGVVNGAAAGPSAPALPSAAGPATPGGPAGASSFNRVSLPGQQRPVTVAPSAAAAGAAGGTGAATGATSTGTGTTARSGGGGGGAASTEKVNYDNITDVMGYVGGVDLREETDNIMRDSDGYSKTGGGDGQDRTRIQNFVDVGLLKTTIERIAASHKLQTIEPDVLAYLAMAAQERLRGLAEQMVHASKHRGRSLATATPPMYDEEHAMYRVGVSQDVKKQLLAVERVEREEETKRKEHIAERERRLAAGEDLDENGDPRGGPGGAAAKKNKKQKEGGPGVSARNMSEEARKKVANQTAMGFAGGSGRTYSWMMGSGGAGGGGGGGGAASPSPLAGPPIVASTGTASAAGSPSASGTAANGAGGSLKPSLSRGSTMPTSATQSGTPTIGGAGGEGVGGVGGAAGAGASSGAVGSPSLVRGAGAGGSMILPPSTLGRPTNLRDSSRKVNVRDALFCLERDRGGGGGEGSGQRVLVKSYVKWLK
ncbi:MAG: transcription initiation factor TFIID component TAF4 family-domain-containing protein [Linnemannia gamsii]|nr:MAG: transcription initiation factor TFIID component TAF4 family-domain-containing protein [Linnemannia gamsii]